jgi:DNA-binding NarL/FixJ family response regulator
LALTERERQILRLHAEGLSDYRIARKLNMEMPNVKRSRKNALKKIDVVMFDKTGTLTKENSALLT